MDRADRRIIAGAGHRQLTLHTPLGRKARPKILAKGAPLIRVKPKDLAAAGGERVPRVVGVRDGQRDAARIVQAVKVRLLAQAG